MSFNPHQWYLNGLRKVSGANTFIGGVASVINTPALLATKLGISVGRISNFSIVGNDIQCVINGSYVIPANCFKDNTSITYYVDNDNLVTDIFMNGFNGTTKLKSVIFGGVINLTGTNIVRYSYIEVVSLPNCLTVVNGGFYDTGLFTSKVFHLPKVTSLGSTTNVTGNADNVFHSVVTGGKLYINDYLRTINAGNPDTDITYIISRQYTAIYVTNTTAPNPITNLSIGNVYATALQLNFTAPTSTNAIDYYEVWLNGIITDKKVTASGQYVTGLTPGTPYSIELKPVDIYYNKSTSNIVTQLTATTYIIPTANLVSYYKMEGNVLDSWGTNNGTATAITYASGLVGQAAVLGATSKINCGNAVNLQLSTVSLVCIVKSANFGSGDKGILFKRYAYNIFTKGNFLSTYSYGTPVGYKETGINIADNINHVIILTQQNGTNNTKIYLDGNLVLTTTIGQTAQTDNFEIGAIASNIGITAQIDEVSIFNKVLSAVEISEINAKLQTGQSLI